MQKKSLMILNLLLCVFCGMVADEPFQIQFPLFFPNTIYHAFDTAFEDIIKQLSSIKKAGFTHIQISPCQKSRTTLPHTTLEDTKKDLIKKFGGMDNIPRDYLDQYNNLIKNAQKRELGNVWWLAYQPVSYEIGGKYGSEVQLKQLIEFAKKYDLKIIADIVFNHVAGLDGVEEREWINAVNRKKGGDSALYDMYMKKLLERHPEFTLEDFNPFKTTKYDYDGKLPGIWLSGALPSLNLRSERVKKAQYAYLTKLINLGIEGFRFDAIKYFPPDIWKEFCNFMKKQNKFIYGELVDIWSNKSAPNPYTSYTMSGPTTDFVLLNTLVKTFRYKGNLMLLRVPRTNGDPLSVTFAENHDTKEEQINLHISNPIDRKLATFFILARHDGVPLILADEYTMFPELAIGVQFRNAMKKMNAPMEYVVDSEIIARLSSQEVIIMLRGSDGFMILNKSANKLESILDFNKSNFNLNLSGEYTCLNNQKKLLVAANNTITLVIPPRNALFFVSNKDLKSKL